MTFSYNKPPTLPEALALVFANPARLPIVAGGTDIIVQWRSGLVDLKGVIDVSGIGELREIRDDDVFVDIGALATHSLIASSEAVQRFLPPLAAACKTIGATQIQNRGTIGGNIMNASPAGDTLPVLLACDAELLAQNLTGERWIAARDFFTGYRKTALAPNELLTRIRFPKIPADETARFYKVGTRRAQTISKVAMCVKAKIYHGGIEHISIAFGSVAPTVLRASGTEALLKGKAINSSLIEKARHSIEDEVHPIDDVRSTADYRRHVCGSLLVKFLREATAKPAICHPTA